ncbi:hypothetical protein BDV93DRAFT_557089 [Ceratobasidium sp. AG-I]|nr:hypothetical protein BDV93DRAFT_557089 [Ceratobasidium sp. AG-I]
MRELLDTLPLLAFLDAYPEPAFILCSNASPQATLAFIYGNSALQQLMLGEDETAVLNDSTFFNVLSAEHDLRWLANPTRPAVNSHNAAGGYRNIEFRPAWLPRNHVPLQLELTATPVDLPLTIPAVNSASHSYVYIASPRKTPMQLLRTEAAGEAKQQQRSNLRLGDVVPTVAGQTWQKSSRSRSIASVSQSSNGAMDESKLPSRLLYTFPWEKTSLGPRSQWPLSLTTMVHYIMQKPVPTTLYWGWPELVMIYNDPYAKLAGTKHPSIYGQQAHVAWDELWDSLNPVAELCRKGQSTSKVPDPLFFTSLTEFGLPQEIYHTWHWTPIWKEDGTVGGALNSSFDTTLKIIAERRLACVSDLISELSETRTQESLMQTVLDVLSRYAIDLPFLALYRCNSDDERPQSADQRTTSSKRELLISLLKVTLTRVGLVGIPEDHKSAPTSVQYTLNPFTLLQNTNNGGASITSNLNTPEEPPTPGATQSAISRLSNPWPFPDVFASGTTEIVNPIPKEVSEGLQTRGFGDPPNTAAMIPIPVDQHGANTITVPHAILIVGLNTRRPYDADYAKWLGAVATAFSNRLMVVLQMEADAEIMKERIRLDKAKSKFFMTVSHELRTPLTLIQAPLEQLVGLQSLSAAAKRKTELATRNVKRLRKLVDSILDMSKLEAGQLAAQFRPVQLDQLTIDMASLFQSMAEKKGVKLQLEVQNQTGAVPPTYVDILLWEKIFCNLLSNAFKYTTKGKITVSVTYDFTFAYLRVCDTGIGIPLEKQQEVFEQFHRVHDLPVEGTGIGLALAKELVTLHGGELTVSSRAETEHTENVGSIFTVAIPLGSNHLPPAMVSAENSQPPVLSKNSKDIDYWMELEAETPSLHSSQSDDVMSASSTLFFEQTDVILVVDDNADMRGFLRSIFAPYLTIIEAKNGLEALEIARTHEVNLILCDVVMPKMDGLELLSKLREDAKTLLIPLIFVTAATDDVGLFDGRMEGIVDCILKPFRVRDLLARCHLQLQIGKRRIKLENSFSERSRELQTLTDLCPVGIFRTDPNGALVYVNPMWYQITGFEQDKDKDEWLDHIHPDSRTEALKAWRGCFLDKKASNNQLQWLGDRWTQFNIAPLLTPEGAILGAFGTLTDITDLHLLEDARVVLAEERERTAALRAEDAERQRKLEEERRRAQELLIDVTSHELRQPVSAILQNAEVVRANMKTFRDDLARCHNIGINYYPTEETLEELEDDLQAMDSITQCGLSQARIANDILSLSKIQLNVLSILPTAFDVKHEVQQILLVFKNELSSKNISLGITFGKGVETLGLGNVLTDRSRFTQIITNLMSNAIRFTEMSTKVREIKVALDVALDPPANELCALPADAPTRTPSKEDNSPIYIYMSIQDSGPGLQQEDLALLFQRFQQGSNAHHVFGGSGLGLFVCRQLCSLMGGRIEVNNAPGSGAIFRFFIQAAKPSDKSPTQEPPMIPQLKAQRTLSSSPSKRQPPTQSLHVLITEDNKINQGIILRQMKRAGFTAVMASNGVEAIEAIQKLEQNKGDDDHSRFDVILMDLQMPVMDGFSAIREIRRLEGDGSFKKRNFILAVTGNARSEQVQAARDCGVDDVIIKPYVLDKLLAIMLAGAQSRTVSSS